VDEHGINVIRQWLDEKEVDQPDREALKARLDIYESCGPAAIRAITVDLENGFWALLSQRKGGKDPCLVFYYDALAEDEITLLACAFWDTKKKRAEPRYVAGVAEERLEALRADRKRRRLERFI
jgi:hypothetical protein